MHLTEEAEKLRAEALAKEEAEHAARMAAEERRAVAEQQRQDAEEAAREAEARTKDKHQQKLHAGEREALHVL
eukprot:408243-Rhodomonas_salina.1